MKKLFFVVLVFNSSSFVFAQAPGNVSGSLIWWLKSNLDVLEANGSTAEDGDGVDVWDDKSSGDIDAETGSEGSAATRPIYRTGIINGNPALEFDGTKFLDGENVSGVGPTESFHMFLVFKQTNFQTIADGRYDDQGTFIIDRPTGTAALASFKVVHVDNGDGDASNDDRYFYQRRQDDNSNLDGPVSASAVNTTSFVIAEYFRTRASAASSTEGIYLDGGLEISQAGPTGNITGEITRIGMHADRSGNGLEGYMTEVILYNNNLSTANRQRIESYLAIKYGITLNSGMDYVRSNGTVIYPSTGSHASYVTDIAGIGRDDNSALNQTTSRSQSTNYVVTASGASSLGNGEFLVWGHNNGSLTAPNSVDVDGTTIKRRLSRVWRLAETGNVGNFTLSFDLSSVPGAKVQADLRLLIDRDGDGFFDNDRTPLTGTLAGSVFTVNVAAANLNNNDYFTIGTTNTSSTPLPIELSAFDVTYEPPVVVASWRTESELNNDYFTLERAGEDLNFSEVATQKGSGTSNIRHSYSAIDPYPYEGRSYYRLKQTDYDGAETYSATKFMFIEGKANKLSVYPNPNDGRVLRFTLGTSLFNLTEVEVMNQQGSIIETKYVEGANLREYPVELKQRLAEGLYVLRVKYNGKDEYIKLIVK